mmetsp:Transcript_8655/g.13152  ORF Transcript_8655/g.13152 Transcript_8655/m.13152 type:complete len:418 (+) Transcript_8655:34-1287(+)
MKKNSKQNNDVVNNSKITKLFEQLQKEIIELSADLISCQKESSSTQSNTTQQSDLDQMYTMLKQRVSTLHSTLHPHLHDLEQKSYNEWLKVIATGVGYKGRRPTMEDAHVAFSNYNTDWGGGRQPCAEIRSRYKETMHVQRVINQLGSVRDNNASSSSSSSSSDETLPYHCFLAVYDGHGGAQCAKFAGQCVHYYLAKSAAFYENIEQALTEAFLRADQRFLKQAIKRNNYSGSTACVCFVRNTDLYTANIGDSRAVLCRNGKPIALSNDHTPAYKPDAKRVENAGGKIVYGRVNGKLAVTRAFGDLDYKQHKHLFFPEADFIDNLVIASPEISHHTLQPDQDEFVVVACDGLWDVMSNKAVCTTVCEQLKTLTGNNPYKYTRAVASQIAKLLIDQAMARGTTDNVSVVVGLFQWQK